MELTIPKHVAIIMDGNGRWAKEKGKIRLEGHRQGAANLEKIIEHSMKIGIKYLTVYAFSTENWKRPEKEINGLMELFSKYLDGKKKNLKKQGIKLLITGSEENISEKLIKKIKETQKYLENCENMVFNIAFNYGGRKEITDAVNKILETGKKNITETEFREYLYRPDIPDPELIIRTSGEFRISNFLLWEIAYSEFYVTDVYWPDFTPEEYDKAIMSFSRRDRRYGGLNAK
ncbi:di-trans,poly-cis-decaprenylcistransferase [Leptotrichia sp. OH3620_COT-345]|uniref:polyprenyl diphosphate synthase n=1 Tax=Leptotrichia sp. OH3620_COT-345 TaxID=2491048 RepID=UPI000F654CEA|nr:polyprenyl diphosphate synthase [Leptotrichia sp. OH3620_COT-345]RRD39371.1 di-trans,poly-cis-decaprenylcistransferase [Leptotrichia sp. OH3620_COT-345]